MQVPTTPNREFLPSFRNTLIQQLDSLPQDFIFLLLSNICDGNCCIIPSFGGGIEEKKRGLAQSLLFSISLPCPEALVVWPVWRSGSCGRKLLLWDCVPDCLLPCQHYQPIKTAHTPSALSHTHTYLSHKQGCAERSVSVCLSVLQSVPWWNSKLSRWLVMCQIKEGLSN